MIASLFVNACAPGFYAPNHRIYLEGLPGILEPTNTWQHEFCNVIYAPDPRLYAAYDSRLE